MTDPLTAVGSTAAILQLATAAATTSIKVYQFVSTIKNAPREIQNLGRDIEDFHTLVQHLSEALKSTDICELIDREKPISRAVADLQYPIGNVNFPVDKWKANWDCSSSLTRLKAAAILIQGTTKKTVSGFVTGCGPFGGRRSIS